MKRIAKILVATALMVVLMATAVSPAFASQGAEEPPGGGRGYAAEKDRNEPFNANTKQWGWACGNEKHDKVYYCDVHD